MLLALQKQIPSLRCGMTNKKTGGCALTAAGDGWDDGEFVVVGGFGGFLAGQIADVVVVEVDVDEGAQLAVGGVEVLAEVGICGDQLGQSLADGVSGNVYGLLASGVGAQRRGDMDVH